MTSPAPSVQTHPRYQMFIDGKEQWLTLREAGAAYNNGLAPVSIGNIVVDSPGANPRQTTEGDRQDIFDAAEKHSDSK